MAEIKELIKTFPLAPSPGGFLCWWGWSWGMHCNVTPTEETEEEEEAVPFECLLWPMWLRRFAEEAQ